MKCTRWKEQRYRRCKNVHFIFHIPVIALGELLVDFTNNGTSDQGNMLFEANPGGAPCNVLAILAKLGKKTAFIGKVGNDMFGAMLKGTIERVGISSKELKVDKNVNTTYISRRRQSIFLLSESRCRYDAYRRRGR